MQLQRPSKIFKKLSPLLLILTAQLSLSNCASFITIAEDVPDSTWCHPFKNAQGVDLGASCDNFLTSNPQTYNQADWLALQASWGITECTTSSTMIALKVFVEDTCSQVTCDQATKQAFLERLQRIGKLGVEP